MLNAMLIPYQKIKPQVPQTVYIAENASLIGDVVIGEESSVWFNVVIRGDVNKIRIGQRTNIQDGTVVHVTHKTHPTIIGDDVTVGHNVTLHGCTVRNACLIGIGATLLDGVEVGDFCLIAAGSLVVPGTKIPPRSMVRGAPAKVVRQLTSDECEQLLQSARNYVGYRLVYLESES